jgi:hypothetical protein
MRFNITDQLISEFFSGVAAVLAVIAVGAFIMFLLKGMGKKAPFIRIALALALAPMSLINFLGRSESTALVYFAMAITLMGIIIDGLNHLLQPRERTATKVEPVIQEQKQEQEKPEADSNPGVFVWEKAE